jgi:hypothetical protein
LQVDGKLEFGGLLHRYIGGLSSVQDLAGIDPDSMKHVQYVGSVAHQSTPGDKIMTRVSRRYSVARRQGGKLPTPANEECIGRDKQRIDLLATKSSEGRVSGIVLAL